MRELKYWLWKIVGAITGGSFAGYIGLIVGFLLGAVIDKLHKDGGQLWSKKNVHQSIETDDFVIGAIFLAAAVVKSDGVIDDLELSYVRSFLIDQFGSQIVDDYWHVLTDAVNKNLDLKKTTLQIRKTTTFETRLQLIYFLFGIANADYKIDEIEVATVKVISIHLGINATEFNSIKAMFYSEMDAYYKILGIAPSASDNQVREAYHHMLQKYHPDKLAYLGEGVEKAANLKFLKVKEAYDSIKSERGFR
ncbi:MAG: TerB family tellurite resistance protein [Saprospiraceae bacterium]|nr:TerB family tellurite resistance protein [Saprospiraceae bacterium]